MALAPTDHYPIISADCHAGASHAVYREYLEAKYHEDFDAWRGKYKNPYKDLRATDDRIRNWDNERCNGDQERDGVVGEVVFPNTVPPFFPSFVLFAPQPTADTYEHRLAGIRAHNRWLVDWCNEFPERRAGIGQIFLPTCTGSRRSPIAPTTRCGRCAPTSASSSTATAAPARRTTASARAPR